MQLVPDSSDLNGVISPVKKKKPESRLTKMEYTPELSEASKMAPVMNIILKTSSNNKNYIKINNHDINIAQQLQIIENAIKNEPVILDKKDAFPSIRL